MTAVVQGPGHQLFTGTGLPVDQYRGIDGRQQRNTPKHLHKDLIVAQQRFELVAGLESQRIRLLFTIADQVKPALDARPQLGAPYRFAKEIA